MKLIYVKISILLVMLVQLIQITSIAATTINITVGSVTKFQGEYATIEVNMDAYSEMTVGTFELNYDSNILVVENPSTDVVLGSYLTGMKDYNVTTSKINFTCISTNKINGGGILVSVKFKVVTNAPLGDTLVTLTVKEFSTSDTSYNSVNIPFNCTNGMVTVKSVIPASPITVLNFDVMDSVGNTLTELPPNGNVYISAMLKNGSTANANPIVIITLYKNSIVKFKIAGRTSPIFKGKTGEISDVFELPPNVDGCTLKVMVWESTTTIRPISNIISIN